MSEEAEAGERRERLPLPQHGGRDRVVDRLYSKVLNIAEALEDVKNMLEKTLREL